jgi:Cu(I)/Ag(I) efflux system membrane protein CusA/SilA
MEGLLMAVSLNTKVDNGLAPAIKELHEVFEHVNRRFFEGKLPAPIITIQSQGRKSAYGWCTSWASWQKAKADAENDQQLEGRYEINLSAEWLPLGAHNSIFVNFLFVASIVAAILIALMAMVHNYERIMRWALANKWKFLMVPAFTLLFGILVWQGFDRIFGFAANGFEKLGWKKFREIAVWQSAVNTFPGIGKEFMPSLNEGSFLLMPTSMPHSSIEMNLNYVETLDKRLSAIPEVEIAVGKWGRVNSALDPAPVQMFENTINYKSEYLLDENGHRKRFKTDKEDRFVLNLESIKKDIANKKIKLDKNSIVVNGIDLDVNNIKSIVYDRQERLFNLKVNDSLYSVNASSNNLLQFVSIYIASCLIPDENGDYFRQWRDEIRNPNDIWNEIVKVTNIPGLTSAPKLQPIETRLVMLSTGMRAPMGLKVYGPDLATIEKAGLEFESALKDVPSIKAQSVFYDRAVGAPYIEINLNR